MLERHPAMKVYVYTQKIPMCVNPACAFAATDKNNMIAFPQAGIAYCFTSNFIPVKAMIPPDNIFATKTHWLSIFNWHNRP